MKFGIEPKFVSQWQLETGHNYQDDVQNNKMI